MLNFFFTFHGVKKDAKRLSPLLKDTEFLILELLNWSEEDYSHFNSVSLGKTPCLPKYTSGFLNGILEQIYNTGMSVHFADISKSNLKKVDYSKIERLRLSHANIAIKSFLINNIEKLKSETKEALLLQNKRQFIRDKHIEKKLRSILPKLKSQMH